MGCRRTQIFADQIQRSAFVGVQAIACCVLRNNGQHGIRNRRYALGVPYFTLSNRVLHKWKPELVRDALASQGSIRSGRSATSCGFRCPSSGRKKPRRVLMQHSDPQRRQDTALLTLPSNRQRRLGQGDRRVRACARRHPESPTEPQGICAA